MFYHDWHPERRPLFHLGKLPVRVTGLIVMIHVAAALLHAVTGGLSVSWMVFSVEKAVTGFQVWRFVTHPLAFSMANLFWAIGLFFFASFGGVVESALGRTRFATLYLCLVLLAPVLIILCWLATHAGVFDALLTGSWFRFPLVQAGGWVHTALFLCVCRLHPDAPFFLPSLKLKWVGLVILLVSCLELLLPRRWDLLLLYLATVAYALWFLRGRTPLPELTLWRDVFGRSLSLPKVRVTTRRPPPAKVVASDRGKPSGARRYQAKIKAQTVITDDQAMAEVDRVLDKISREGLASLTQEERDILSRASERLDRDRKR